MHKLKQILCVFFGHSRIVETCFGYVHCARCGDQIGDALAGVFNGKDVVIVGHDCKDCRKNWTRLTWKDKLLAPYPFKVRKQKRRQP